MITDHVITYLTGRLNYHCCWSYFDNIETFLHHFHTETKHSIHTHQPTLQPLIVWTLAVYVRIVIQYIRLAIIHYRHHRVLTEYPRYCYTSRFRVPVPNLSLKYTWNGRKRGGIMLLIKINIQILLQNDHGDMNFIILLPNIRHKTVIIILRLTYRPPEANPVTFFTYFYTK